MNYTIKIEGVTPELDTWFDKLKLTQKNSDHPPKNIDELSQEEVALGAKLRKALIAKGYYDAVVDEHLAKQQNPPALRYTVTLSDRYHLSSIRVDWQDPELRKLDIANFPEHVGDAVDAEIINNHAAKLETEIGKDACLLSLNVLPLLELDSATHTAALIYQVKHGARATFGATTVEGNQALQASAILRSISWKQGECYTENQIAKTRSTLIGTQLYSTVKIITGTSVDSQGEVPMTVEVTERVPHTIKAGANYASDQGFGVTLGWEDRNFSGDAEKVNIDGVLAQEEQSLALTERIGGFVRNDQTLVLSSSIKHENTTAYNSDDINAGAAVERKFAPSVNTGVGLDYLLTRSRDAIIGYQNFGLIYAPLFMEFDNRDNAQDARKGFFGRASVTPYVDTFDISTDFAKTQLTGQTYISSDVLTKPTLALRASIGGIEGSTFTSLPANLRYYAGGGGSVRGYGYQTISPRYNGEAIGGGSLIEISSELRLRFTEQFGGVAFIDGGNAYASSVPHLGEQLYYGAGVGVRYYSPLGPLRLDVAEPLNGHNIDQTGYSAKGYAIYVSLGQAF